MKHMHPRTKGPAWFVVASAEYGEIIPVLDYGQGPMEYGRDVLHVFARHAARAKTLAVRAWRRHYKGRRKPWYLDEDSNPFKGMTVERCTAADVAEYRADRALPELAAVERAVGEPHRRTA